ncbi:MAG: rRNA maturation RNase YbeY [Burkholderiales bacterium]|nr:rRNA maturation RNase YbeY [Burkholderiales bacterium]
MGSRGARLTLSVQSAAKGHALPARARLRQWAQAALERDTELTLRIVGEMEGRRLNAQFRGKDYATNVLTFAYGEPAMPGMPLCGDIVLCAPVIENEALDQSKPLEAHYAHLVVHAILHLHGYDHEFDDEAQAMEARESAIVMRLGYPDPYLPAAETPNDTASRAAMIEDGPSP